MQSPKHKLSTLVKRIIKTENEFSHTTDVNSFVQCDAAVQDMSVLHCVLQRRCKM